MIEDSVKRRQYGSQVEEAGEFTYQGVQHLDVLMKLKKYDKAIIVAEEIVEFDKENKKIGKILKQAKSKFFAQSRDDSIQKMKSDQKKLKEEYLKDKSKFIKL